MDRGFHEFEGFMGFMVSSYFEYELDINRKVRKYDNRYLTDDLTERAIDFVRRHKEGPFFLHLAHYAPHRPLNAPHETVDYYLKMGINENTAIIYAMIEIMDSGIGQLIKELDTLGIRENTLVIFSSDNGPDPIPGARENLGLKGAKYTVYEGGIRVPFLVNWKDSFEPGKVDEPVHFIDVFPTLVGICNLKFPEPVYLEGRSLTGLLRGLTANQIPETRFWQWNRGVPVYSHNAAMRQGDWKLVRPYVTHKVPDGPSSEKPVLYNLELDPCEKVDVSGSNRRVYENMNVLLEEWCREVEFHRLKIK
jgi:arylsulfatase A